MLFHFLRSTSLEGDARFYNKIVMLKDDYYARKCAEEEEKAAKRSKHASIAAVAKHEAEARSDDRDFCPGMPEQTKSNQNKSNQSKSKQNKSNQSKSKQNKSTDMKSLRSSCSEPCGKGSEPAEAPVIKISLIDGSDYPVFQKNIDGWQETYQAVDVYQQLKEIRSWSEANPTRRKTSRGVRRFINTWLAKEQDRGGGRQQGAESGYVNKKAQMLEESRRRLEAWANE